MSTSRTSWPTFRCKPRAVVFPRLASVSAAGCLSLPLAACGGAPPSPSMPLFGAYFPSWLFCVAFGIIGALIVRVVFVRLGIDDELPFRLLVYTCLSAAIGFASALAIYGL